MVLENMMEQVYYIWVKERKKDRQSMWTIIFMDTKKVWNMLMFIFCVGARRDKSPKIRTSQFSIEEWRIWRRILDALRLNDKMCGDEAKDIAEMMLREINEQQSKQIKEEYPQVMRDNRRNYTTKVWSKDEMVTVIQEEIEGLQQQLSSKYRDQQKIELDMEMKVLWKKSIEIPKRGSERFNIRITIEIDHKSRSQEKVKQKSRIVYIL